METATAQASAGPAPLALTGERTLPGIAHEAYWFARHEVVYRWTAPLAATATVLEAGCGEGYGAQLLLDTGAAAVIGVDYDASTVTHVARTYPGVRTLRANLVALPLAARSLDLVVSLQTVEHLWEQPRFIAECARVLRPGGRLVISTPNRLTFSPDVARGEKPLNPFHVNELDPEELTGLVSPWVEVVSMHGVRHGPRLTTWEAEHGPLVGAQLSRSPEEWSRELAAMVASVRSADFEVGPSGDDALDLVLVGAAR